MTAPFTDAFEAHRPRLFGLAYRMLGSAADAEDTRLVELAAGAPAGRVADMGGPEVRTMESLAHAYLKATGRRRPTAHIALPGRTFRAFREGGHLTPRLAVDKGTFEDYLERRFGGGAQG